MENAKQKAMKHLILKLKKKVLIVESDLTDLQEQINSTHFEGQPIKFICKGSELTEEKLKEVDIIETKPYGSHPYFCTIYYRSKQHKSGFRPGLCADTGKQYLDSFKSAIEANDFWWLKHDMEDEISAPDIQEWQQAEEKTFRNCLIFEIL